MRFDYFVNFDIFDNVDVHNNYVINNLTFFAVMKMIVRFSLN